MTRLIDVDAVYKWYLEAFNGQIKPNEIRFSINDIRGNLENIPTIDAEPVRHGKWIMPKNEISQKLDEWICDNCNYLILHRHKYCPNCGADMRGKE